MVEKKTKNRLSEWWSHVTLWMLTHKKTTASVAVLAIVFSASLVSFALFYQRPVHEVVVPVTTKVAKKKPAPAPKYYSPLTGLPVATEALTTRPITAIMIENSLDARPQSGLQDAEVTYEAIAEGGITRFLNLYQENKPQLIGPVRSLRMYYVDWLTPYDPSVAHVGGSYYALQEIRNGKHRDIDQFFNGSSYWRSTDRYAPHNVYTSFAKLDALNASKGYTSSQPQPLKHGDVAKPQTPNATYVDVHMSGSYYDSAWQYDAASNKYLRNQNGSAHTDREKGQITTDVLVVMKMQMNRVFEDGYREDYQDKGTGDGVVFQNGTATEVIWHKDGMGGQVFFTDKASGKEFLLARGKTWLTAIPVNQGGAVSWR